MSITFDDADNKLMMKTRSGNEYELFLKDILLNEYTTTVEYLNKFGVNILSYDECKSLADSVELQILANLNEMLKDGEFSDGYNNVLKFDNRPFKDMDEMDRLLIENWNSRITKKMIRYTYLEILLFIMKSRIAGICPG